MTNTELIQAIRNEIEKRREKYQYGSSTLHLYISKDFTELLSFLSTLEESERPKPYNPVYDEAYLNEKIKKATESWKGVDVDAMLAECRGYDEEKSEKPTQEGLEEEIREYMSNEDNNPFDWDWRDKRDCARHFAKWGADHTPLPEDTVLFNKGVAEGKRLMMEEAVEGEVVKTFPEDGFVSVHYPIPPIGRMAYFCKYNGQNIGDKVRIIVLPKEDEK